MSTEIKIDFDFEELDKLPIEEYNKLEKGYLEFVTKLLTASEKDYCKKKGWDKDKLNFEQHSKMMRAVNRRKECRKAGDNLLKFNKAFRHLILNKEDSL